jgi:hypothetical protein
MASQRESRGRGKREAKEEEEDEEDEDEDSQDEKAPTYQETGSASRNRATFERRASGT